MFLHLLRTENVLRFCLVSVNFFVLQELGTETKNHTADFIMWTFFCMCPPQTCFGVSECLWRLCDYESDFRKCTFPPPPTSSPWSITPPPPPPRPHKLLPIAHSVCIQQCPIDIGLPINSESDEFDSTNGGGGGGGGVENESPSI